MTNDFTTISISEVAEKKITTRSNAIFDDSNGKTFRNIINELANLAYGSNVKVIDDPSLMPPIVNGEMQLEHKGYRFLENIILNGTPILIPAGYNGVIQSVNPPLIGLTGVGMGGVPLFRTLNLDGPVTSIVDAGDGLLLVTTPSAHGILEGQYVNLSDTGVPSYEDNGSRLLTSNNTTFTFCVPLAYVSDVFTGNFDTGANGFIVDFMAAFSEGSAKLFDITMSREPTTLFSWNSFFSQGFYDIGIVRKATFVVADRGELFPIDKGLTLEDCVNTSLNGDVIEALDSFGGGSPMLEIKGAATKNVFVTNSTLNPFGVDQFPIRIDDTVNNARISIFSTPDNDVTPEYYDTSDGGLNQKNPQINAQSNGSRMDSMIQGEVRVKPAGIEVIASQSPEFDPVPLVDLNPSLGDYIANADNERFTTDLTTGALVYIGKKPTGIRPTYTIEATKVGGGSQTLVFAIFRDKNLGAGYEEISNTRITFVTSVVTEKSFSGTFFNIKPQEKFLLYKLSDDGSNTNIHDGTKLMLLK